jgi:hypothetical protein
MAIFDRLDRMTSRVADRQFAVAATVTPMRSSPNGRSTPDPERGEILCKGIFDEMPVTPAIEIGRRGRGGGNDFQTIVEGENYQFSVDKARYPDAANIRQNDKLILDDARKFKVDSVRPDGMSRIVLVLSEL